MDIEEATFERTGDVYAYDNRKQYGNQQWLSE